jgi:hypothetical protein
LGSVAGDGARKFYSLRFVGEVKFSIDFSDELRWEVDRGTFLSLGSPTRAVHKIGGSDHLCGPGET